jgi:hypothetical protein
MEFPGSDPFAVPEITEKSQAARGLVLRAPPLNQVANRMGAASRTTKRLQRRSFRRRNGPIYPAPVAPCNFFTDASDLPENQGFEEDKHVGGDSVETETKTGDSPPRLGHADSSSLDSASVIDPSPRPWKKRCVLDTLNLSITLDFVLLSSFDATDPDVIC